MRWIALLFILLLVGCKPTDITCDKVAKSDYDFNGKCTLSIQPTGESYCTCIEKAETKSSYYLILDSKKEFYLK